MERRDVDERPEHLAGVEEGQILAGKYRVERVLGVGGMGVVVAARHIELDSQVALKFLLPALVSNPEAVGRFAREARNAVRIQNEHVARVLDVGMLANGAPYLVMEFLEGEDLATWLLREGCLSVERAVEFVLQACVAVAEAHGLGIIHRDLKPANLFCVRRSDGQFIIKVLDFGISKTTDVRRASETPGMSFTKTTAVMGSPLYMSPEQMRSAKDVDGRTDIWALGIILYQLLSGKAPFYGETVAEVAVRVASDPSPSLLAVRPDAAPGLEMVIFKCLEKDRNRRYPHVAELALALLPFGPKESRALVARIAGTIQAAGLSKGTLAMPPSPRAQSHGPNETIVAPGSVAPWSGTVEGRKSKKALLWGLGVTGLVAAGGGPLLFWRFLHPPRTEDAAQSARTLVDAAVPDDAGEVADASAAIPECLIHSTRCHGATLVTCPSGHWVDGTVRAGECGAACTPGASPPQCNGNTPQVCAPTGEWKDGSVCGPSSRCRNGVCTPWSAPPPPPTIDPGSIR